MNDVVPLLKFTPSAQDPEILEALTVQREPLIAALVDSALDTQGGVRHHLLVGPRGIGKTHILALVASRVRAAEERAGSVVVAWLDEDPWAVRTYDKFLAAILARVAAEIDDPELARSAAALRSGGDGTSEPRGEDLLRGAVGDRRLVLLVENLDEIFRRIGLDGQAKFRAFAEDWRQLLILATTPQLFAGVRRHTSPFYGFFAVTHLDELSLASATELLKRIARLRGDSDLLQFLNTETASRRLKAIEALAGGHPRIWLLLAGCISIAAIDELVPLFLEALDDLTPYYQDRLRELGDQQQELVVLLGEAGGALSNRALAQRSGIAQNQVATMLRQLADRGYIRSAQLPGSFATGDKRMSFWELREPLMRLCLDVKQARGEPLRMVVEFLRAWYGPRLLDELGRLPSSAQHATIYASEAFRTLEIPLGRDDLLRGSPSEIIARAERGLSLRPRDRDLESARAMGLLKGRRFAEARDLLKQMPAVKESGLGGATLRLQLAIAQAGLGESIDSDALLGDALDLRGTFPNSPGASYFVGTAYIASGRNKEALAAFARASELDPGDVDSHHAQGFVLARLGRGEEALEAYRRAGELNPGNASHHNSRAGALRVLGRLDDAEQAARRAIELDDQNAIFRFTLAEVVLARSDFERALPLLREALAVWHRERAESPGDTDLLCRTLWERFQDDARRREIITQIVLAYGEVDGIEELGRGVVSSIPLFVDDGVSQRDADAWVEDWSKASSAAEIEIPVNMLQAARLWKHDQDRAHLLTLPQEQRAILVDLLAR